MSKSTDAAPKKGLDAWNDTKHSKQDAQKKRSQKAKKTHRKHTKEVRRYITTLVVLVVCLGVCAFLFTPINQRITQGLDLRGGVSIIMKASKPDGSAVSKEDMATATTIVQTRVNSLGASETSVQQQGNDKILIQIPGATNAQEAVSTVGKTGKLEFVKMDDIGDADALAQIQRGAQNVKLKEGSYKAFMTGSDLASVAVGQNSNNADYAVNLRLNAEGTKKFAEVTKELAPTHGQIAIVLDGQVDSAPAVQSVISNGEVSITGNYTLDEAKQLKTVLDSGSLPVTLTYSESRVVGPTLGQDSLHQAMLAIIIGMLIVAVYLFVFYRGMGLLTFGSLGVFAVVYLGILAVLSHFGMFALSLPGLAGMVLTIGMAADSSILILERVREEIRMGRSIRKASITGVHHGIETSLDADVVTLVSALALLVIATGPVKGFGLTLALGIACDIVTMIAFKAPAIRLLARNQMEKHPRFWGIDADLSEAEKRNQEAQKATSKASSKKEGGAHA